MSEERRGVAEMASPLFHHVHWTEHDHSPVYTSMNKYIKSLLPIPEDSSVKMFLAGPMRGAPKWQKTVQGLAC